MPLSGLSGLSYPDAVIPTPEATAAEVQGGSADPRHGQATINTVYPWQTVPQPGPQYYHTPYPNGVELAGFEMAVGLPAGSPTDDPRADLTPINHAAPWPTTTPRDSAPRDLENAAEDLQQLASIHAMNTGASREITYTLPPAVGNWQAQDYDTAGQTLLAPGIPKQIAGSVMGRGSTDRIHNPMTRQNEFGFDQAHVTDRQLRQKVPGAHFMLRPGGRPMTIEAHGNTNTKDGPNSPFTGNDALRRGTYSAQGAVLSVTASEYVPPPQPVLAPPLSDAGPVWAEW